MARTLQPAPKSATSGSIAETKESTFGSASSDKEVKGDEGTTNNAEPVEVGMQLGIKNLYEKLDDRRRQTWVDQYPDNLGKPAEDSETAKWVLLIRKKPSIDSRKLLDIHSIVVQSPLLRNFLGGVLKGYPGITVALERLTFNANFEPLVHRWQQFEDAIDVETDPETKSHAELLFETLRDELKETIRSSQDMIANKVMTHEYLWTIFQPGAIIYARQDGQECALKLERGTMQSTQCGLAYNLQCEKIDWDGEKFGRVITNVSIPDFLGTKQITQLPAYPIQYHPKEVELRDRLIERGYRVEGLRGFHYKGYNGIGFKKGLWGPIKYNVQGRIVIDTYCWNRFNPNSVITVQPILRKSESTNNSDDDEGEDGDDAYDSDMDYMDDSVDEDSTKVHVPLTKDQQLICTPVLQAYSLKTKLWLNVFVDSVTEVQFSEGAFDSLVLPEKQKELILAFAESQVRFKKSFDDVIQGKGRGIILLLSGPPGVGKTLTAESVAETMRAPLYMMSAGDLGLDAHDVEEKLSNVLEMCTKWNAVLLLDEADVFLEQRTTHDLERNKLVSVFLRILEYYEGILFLTTNRVQTFDAAFQSRIHISIDYPELSLSSRRQVWTNFLAINPEATNIREKDLDALAEMDMNGRQIKNVLKSAQLLASRKEMPLSHEHIKSVLDVTQHLQGERK
ncbi:MAG: hypothetical protein M1827_000864 [Pycnora praestabilis]|nr:MAG: hypothetical protein M1827_000864 [Pycnora praestabilis]